jgi:sensor histidine kinase regulating citrate/malate metabolism
LTALDMMATNLPELDDAKRTLIRNATARIHNIANNLLDRNFNKDNNISAQMFSSIIRSMIFEKREQYKDKPKVSIHEHVDHQMYGAFAKIELNDFKRMLSNVIDNAVQAISNTGFVRIALTQQDNKVVIEVFDNGKGIAPEDLHKVALKGNTTRKTGKWSWALFCRSKVKRVGSEFRN